MMATLPVVPGHGMIIAGSLGVRLSGVAWSGVPSGTWVVIVTRYSMVGSSWSVEVELVPFGEKEFQSFRTDSGITFCLWPACRGGQVPVPGGSLPRSRSGRPVEPVNPRAGCPVRPGPGQVQTRDTSPGEYGFDAPPEA